MASSGRRSPLTYIAIVAIAFLIIGVIAGRLVRSPQQVLADTAPPAYSTLTNPVTERSLASSFSGSGKVTYPHTTDVTLQPPSDGTTPVITSVATSEGSTLSNGQLLCTVAGSPVFYLSGPFPLYRDISYGDHGPDVTEIQEALNADDITTDVDGIFGASTQTSIQELYARAGTAAPTPTHTAKSPGAITGKNGIVVLQSSFLVAPHSTRLILKNHLHVGQVLSGPALTLASATPAVVVRLPTFEARRVKIGQAVQISAGRGIRLSGSVDSKGAPSSSGQTGLTVPVRVRPKRAISAGTRGISVDFGKARSGHKVLVVPQSAIFNSSDGGLDVEKVIADRQERVTVTLGESADGYVHVIPHPATALKVGDLVAVSGQ